MQETTLFLQPRSAGRRSAPASGAFAASVVLASTLLWLSPPPASAGVVVDLGKSDEVVVPIGQDLEIIWPGGPKEAEITVSLVDATSATIATRTVTVGTSSWSEPILLWPITGVVGCDAASTTGDSRLGFQDFEGALAFLLPETFYLMVEGSETTLPVRFAEPVEPIYYFSDEKGCPRALYERSEIRYLSGWTPGPHTLPTHSTFFLQRPDCDAVSAPILEVRPEPQAISLRPGTRRFTEPIGTGCELGGGPFVGIVHAFENTQCEPLEDRSCGLVSCGSRPADEIYAYAVDPYNLQPSPPAGIPIPSLVRCGPAVHGPNAASNWVWGVHYSGKSQGHTSSDWDDGRCDSCGPVDDGNGGG